jgi:transketolase
MRALPNMTVVVPADGSATASVIAQAAALDGPVYVRLGRKPTPALPDGLEPPRIGAIQPLREGDDVVSLCCGPHPVFASLAAADEHGPFGARPEREQGRASDAAATNDVHLSDPSA